MKKFISLILCVVVYLQASGQDEEIRRGEKGSYLTREVFNVLKENENIKEGPYTMWYEGVKVISGNYSDNKKNGLWKYSNIDGIVYFQGNYLDDKKNGTWKYYRNQKPLAVVYYKDDMTDSICQSFFENGNIQARIGYTSGQKNGIYELYYDNGQLAEACQYAYNQVADTLKRFYRDGSVQFIFQYKYGNIYNVLAMNDSLGKKQDFGTFAEGTGILKRYYSDGKICSEVQYTHNGLNGTATLYQRNGKPASVYNYVNSKRSGKQTEYDKNGLAEYEGECVNGFKTGKWTTYRNGNILYEKEFAEADSFNVTIPVYETPLAVQELMPHAQGGEANMMQFIVHNIEYPKESLDKGISGAVFVTFVVDVQGKIKNTRILRGVPGAADLDKEALRVVSSMPPWTPGFQSGFPVNVQFNLPIKYRLK